MFILYRPINMKDKNLNDYRREYNKETYKTVKVYIREEEYPEIIEHMKRMGYTKLSGYIKDLITKDMTQNATSVKNSNNVIIGNSGSIHME
nr:MAG TPA: bacterial mobilization protein [Inoviridae sp.]